MHGTWVMVHALVEGAEGFVSRFLAVPLEEVTVEDVWFTSGMRATGSNTVVIHDVFVPAHRTIEAGSMLTPAGAGASAEGDPLADYPVPPVLALVAAAPALGAAEAAVELFRARIAGRVLAYSLGEKQADQPASQVRLASAIAEVRSARAVWEAALAELTAAVDAGEPSIEVRMACRLAAAHTVRISRSAISTVCEGSGASIYLAGAPLQRLQRDVEVLKGHVLFDWDRTAELGGRIALGLPPRLTDMI